MNDSSPPLEIPQTAYRAAIEAVEALDLDDLGPVAATDAALAASSAAAPLIVAAELRRLVENFEPVGTDPDDAFDPAEEAYQAGLHDMRARFAARADELDPQGRRVEQAADSWFAPAIPVSPPTGVRVRRARPDGPAGV